MKTLRDEFAMAALGGIISSGGNSKWEDDAEVAYKCADAMLAAREPTPAAPEALQLPEGWRWRESTNGVATLGDWHAVGGLQDMGHESSVWCVDGLVSIDGDAPIAVVLAVINRNSK